MGSADHEVLLILTSHKPRPPQFLVDMLANSYPSQQNNVAQVNNQQSAQNPTQSTDPNVIQQQQQHIPAHAAQTMRLRDDPPPVTPPARSSRKRKSPPNANNEQTSQQQPAPPATTVQHVLPSAHTLVHPPQHMPTHPLPPGYQFATTDFTPGGMPTPISNQPQSQGQAYDDQEQSPPGSAAGRALSSSKRAEQNRKAQRAFRERRDQ